MQEMSPQWKNIGSLIGFTKAQLDVWKMQNPNDPEDCMSLYEICYWGMDGKEE